ncbi:EKC/KEOPS complex subunit LAGE3-like [Talpa occidentalis]|uniref:EKC/KEOPS complex subunit LAGE3-like n=1 Tax=Talpa occidentalis TaxID=50954 RepID=UPI00188E75A2|nr:EKC/KEOPS complex subunit LAGE3-like [Talpa occidentalis]
MQAPVDGAGDRGGRGDRDGRGGRGGRGAVGRAAHGRGRGRGPPGAARRPRIHVHEFTLRVPFLSAWEAEIAYQALAPYEEPHPHAIHKELFVHGSFLVVRWIAEDLRLLQLSFTVFLDQLSHVVRSILHFGRLIHPASPPGIGG